MCILFSTSATTDTKTSNNFGNHWRFSWNKEFYLFLGSLFDITDKQLTKQDYQNLAMTIVETYPSLKGGNNGRKFFLYIFLYIVYATFKFRKCA